MSQALITFVLLIFININFAWAWPPTYGAEFEFFHPNLTWNLENINGPEALQAKAEFMHQIQEDCLASGCKVDKIGGKFSVDYRVTLPNGWWFIVSHDPAVIEITTKPSTLAELRQNTENINQFIFKSARKAKFRVHRDDNAHFNFGVQSAFDNDPKEFLKFFVDYQNNTHLSLGTLGQDFYNAPPLSIQKEEQRIALAAIVTEVNAGKYGSIAEVSKAVMKRVYTSTYDKELQNSVHYQSIGLKYITKEKLVKPSFESLEVQALLNLIPFVDFTKPHDQPIELRAAWSQTSAEHFIKIAELVEARVAFLKKQSSSVVYLKSNRKEINTWREAKTRFYIYVTETGLDFKRYNSLLPLDGRSSELSEFLDKSLPIRERAEALRYYADLISQSQWFRDYSKDLILAGHLETEPRFKSFLAKINEIEKTKVSSSGASSSKSCSNLFVQKSFINRFLNLLK